VPSRIGQCSRRPLRSSPHHCLHLDSRFLIRQALLVLVVLSPCQRNRRRTRFGHHQGDCSPTGKGRQIATVCHNPFPFPSSGRFSKSLAAESTPQREAIHTSNRRLLQKEQDLALTDPARAGRGFTFCCRSVAYHPDAPPSDRKSFTVGLPTGLRSGLPIGLHPDCCRRGNHQVMQ
jgi:hypothetical protein